MTGYGRGDSIEGAYKITTEISSVNRKQSEIVVNLPRELELLEPRVRNEVNRRVARGRVTVKVLLHAGEGVSSGKVQLNTALAKAYARELARLAKELHIPGPVTLDHLLRAPGVLQTDDLGNEAETVWPAVEKSLDQALTALVAMRTREGVHLAKDLKKRIAVMKKSVGLIRVEAPGMVKRYQAQLRERIQNAGLALPAETDERLLKEVVYFADRSDISEELTRLASHFKQFDELYQSAEPVGRTLDFLAQEINRELNTIGSKATDQTISREVIGLKAELEKFREQVQNVE